MSIQEWLDSPQDYDAGRLLYEQHGRNHMLKRTLSHGPTAYNTSCLREELERLAKAGQGAAVVQLVPAVAAAPVVETVIAAQPAPASEPAGPSAVVGQLLADLEKEWLPLYKDASHMQGLLAYAKDNQERGVMSHKILDLMDKVQALWDAGDYVREHGQLPPVPVVTPPAVLDLTDRAAVEQHRNNLRSQISKQKRNKNRAAEVEAWRAEVQQLSDLLKTL